MIKKPAWLIFAAEARQQLDKVTPSKSGKREDRCILDTYKHVLLKFGYPGSEYDWRVLLRRLGKR